MHLIDTHCHLPMISHKPIDEVLANASTCHVKTMLCIGAAKGVESAFEAVALSEKHDCVFASVGIHPHDAGDFTSLAEIAHLLDHEKVVAVGETGLDFFRDWAPKDKQHQLFEASVHLAKAKKKPLIIHCRSAHRETIAELKRLQADEIGGVFHCYAEDEVLARRLLELNFLVSLTGILTFKNAVRLRTSVAKIPLTQIMLETDCPYMAPEPYRGQPSEPAHVLEIAKCLAEIKGLPLEEIARVTTDNARRLWGFQ